MKNLRMELNYLGTTKKDNNWDCHEYKATLKYGSKQLTTPFYTGLGWVNEPTQDDVLASLILDANSAESARDFEDFANEFGYDVDSRDAEKTYKQCVRTAEKLQSLLGSDIESFKKKYENY